MILGGFDMEERSGQEWHEYLVNIEYPSSLIQKYEELENLRNSPEFERLQKKIQPYYRLRYGDLRKTNCAKQIVKEPIKKFPGHKRYPPFTFRFQCLTTGRLSKYIKLEDWSKFGITPKDGRTGGRYSSAMDIDDKLIPVFSAYDKEFEKHISIYREKYNLLLSEITEIRSYYGWKQRYSEYMWSKCWKDKRDSIVRLDQNKCLLTGSEENLCVHHIHYMNVGMENNYELITVSKDVHEKIHSYKGDDFYYRIDIEYKCLANRCKILSLDPYFEWKKCYQHNPDIVHYVKEVYE